MPPRAYPKHRWFPFGEHAAPGWIDPLVEVFAAARPVVNSLNFGNQMRSNAVLAALRPALEALGYGVERGTGQPLTVPLMGEVPRRINVDAFHPGERVLLEIDGGPSTAANAASRNVLWGVMLRDVDYLALAVPLRYIDSKTKARPMRPYDGTKVAPLLEGLQRMCVDGDLSLPLRGTCLIGY